MSNQINRKSMQVHKSVNTPDYPQDIFLNVSGKTLPDCNKKYWKIVGEQVVEMSIAEKTVVDYVEPAPEPIPPTAEEINRDRKKSIADGVAEKYTQADEISMMRKLITGESLIADVDIQEWLDWVTVKKAEHPKVV